MILRKSFTLLSYHEILKHFNQFSWNDGKYNECAQPLNKSDMGIISAAEEYFQ